MMAKRRNSQYSGTYRSGGPQVLRPRSQRPRADFSLDLSYLSPVNVSVARQNRPRRAFLRPSVPTTVVRRKPAMKAVRPSGVDFSRLRFSVPKLVDICAKRSTRRQVLFSQKVAGRSGSAPGPYRRNQDSYFSCRRK